MKNIKCFHLKLGLVGRPMGNLFLNYFFSKGFEQELSGLSANLDNLAYMQSHLRNMQMLYFGMLMQQLCMLRTDNTVVGAPVETTI